MTTQKNTFLSDTRTLPDSKVLDIVTAKVSEVKELCIDGLLTDGAHHKQWFFEEILKSLGYDIDDLKSDLQQEGYSWEDGRTP